jgi:hypothetical protein
VRIMYIMLNQVQRLPPGANSRVASWETRD